MRFSASVISLLLASLTVAAPFGRFGYSASPLVPGFEIDRGGFRAKAAGAPAFRFDQPSTYWKPVATTDISQSAALSGFVRTPTKFRQDLTAPGFQLHFANGFRFRLSTKEAPYLTWHEASVGPGVPTPSVRWVGVSFKDHVPPLVIGFMDGASTVTVKGRAGDWTVESPAKGWVRIALPYGTMGVSTESASKLGALSNMLKRHDLLWFGPSPQLTSTDIVSDESSLTVTWKFSAPNVVVPPPVVLAPLAGYRVAPKSPVVRLDGYTEEGPLAICSSPELTVRFPIRNIGTGRVLATGDPKDESLVSVDSFDPRSVAELALHNLMGRRDRLVRSTVDEAATAFLGEVPTEPEPNTMQRFPFRADGAGLDLAAAHALLLQSKVAAENSEPQENSLLTSVLWRRDWLSWSFTRMDRTTARRAAAIASMACLISDQTSLDAALFEAGLAGERGLGIFLRRKGRIQAEPKLNEPFANLRKSAFFTASGQWIPSLPYGAIRVFGDRSFRVSGRTPTFRLAWTTSAQENFSFVLTGPVLDVLPETNVASVRLTKFGAVTIVDCQCKALGEAAVSLELPEGITLPSMPEWPKVDL
ncbi:MAG TPA: hypothetical protein PKA27_04415 [Fimbriimonadaceae bacterium]|nr:hypothetical protein [Fimbriimonadaceae bacterium]